MNMRTLAGLGLMVVALGACGGREQLKPIKAQKLPAVPVGAATAPTAAQLMQPAMQARPQRNVELLLQSQKRADDPFDLPPEKTPN